jgi:hypothetical protein
MVALQVALSRAVTRSIPSHSVVDLLRRWTRILSTCSLIGLTLILLPLPLWQRGLSLQRSAPILLTAFVPVLHLFLLLTGAGLQGLQCFPALALREGILFGARALLVGACLALGFRAAGWALLAHLLGMGIALGFSIWALRRNLSPHPASTGYRPPELLGDAYRAFPVLAAFAILMSLDIVLVCHWFPADLSDSYAQAATLGRMILWLPLPIASAMFPKVVREGSTSSSHRQTARLALVYTGILTLGVLILAWFCAPMGFHWVYGIRKVPDMQILWFRHLALAMAPLPLLHVWIQYELARGVVQRLWPIVLMAAGFLTLALFRHESILQILQALQLSTLAALAGCGLRWSRIFPAA